MATKKVILTKKIDDISYDVFPKTSADIVVYGETTVSATLAEFANALANVYTKTETDDAIKTSATNLYNKIMGITEEDGATVDEAYDTLKEVAAWIDEHGDIAAGFLSDINALKAAVGDENSGLIKAMADAKQEIQDNATNITALQSESSDHDTRISDLETTVGDDASGLVMRVNDLEAIGATKTEASEINGNIKIDNTETTVYTHPETHNTAMIVEDDTHKFVTNEEKAIIASAAAVSFVQSADDIDNERDLFLIEIE